MKYLTQLRKIAPANLYHESQKDWFKNLEREKLDLYARVTEDNPTKQFVIGQDKLLTLDQAQSYVQKYPTWALR